MHPTKASTDRASLPLNVLSLFRQLILRKKYIHMWRKKTTPNLLVLVSGAERRHWMSHFRKEHSELRCKQSHTQRPRPLLSRFLLQRPMVKETSSKSLLTTSLVGKKIKKQQIKTSSLVNFGSFWIFFFCYRQENIPPPPPSINKLLQAETALIARDESEQAAGTTVE